mgnify:CR=1 FL=1
MESPSHARSTDIPECLRGADFGKGYQQQRVVVVMRESWMMGNYYLQIWTYFSEDIRGHLLHTGGVCTAMVKICG